MSERGQLSIVDSAQKNQRQNRAQQRHCHIGLGIPHIPLGGEKLSAESPARTARIHSNNSYKALKAKQTEITKKFSQARPLTTLFRTKTSAR